MFTGLVESAGSVVEASRRHLKISCGLQDLRLGESIAVNGVCLTVTTWADGEWVADVSEETRRRTSLGSLHPGDPVNLERAMPADGRFGGHIVQGHVDGVGRVAALDQLQGSLEMTLELPAGLERYLVEKGSVAVEGVSLTVARMSDGKFSVSLVPHTLAGTTLGSRKVGDPVNLEVDILAKYVERLLERR